MRLRTFVGLVAVLHDRGERPGCLVRLGLSVARAAVGRSGSRDAVAFDSDVHDIDVRDPRHGR